MALRLDALSVTNPKGLNEDLSSSSFSLDSPFSVDLALTLILFNPLLASLLLLQQLVVEEMERLRVGENIAENTIVAKEKASSETTKQKLATVFLLLF